MTEFEQDLFDDSRGRLTFDFQGFLYKLLRNWLFIVISVGIALGIAYYNNVRKQNIYRLNTLISVETEQNPFFTANTSISFNWGGVSGKIGKIMTTLATRSHNELVVDSLQYYKKYLKQGEYHLLDVYKNTPYEVHIDKSQYQLLGYKIEIKARDANQYDLIIDFEENSRVSAQRYRDRSIASFDVTPGVFKDTYVYGDSVRLPYLNVVVKKTSKTPKPDDQYFVQFLEFDGVVAAFQNSVSVGFFKSSNTVLSLAQSGTNKAKIVDYLNTTAEILRATELR